MNESTQQPTQDNPLIRREQMAERLAIEIMKLPHAIHLSLTEIAQAGTLMAREIFSGLYGDSK